MSTSQHHRANRLTIEPKRTLHGSVCATDAPLLKPNHFAVTENAAALRNNAARVPLIGCRPAKAQNIAGDKTGTALQVYRLMYIHFRIIKENRLLWQPLQMRVAGDMQIDTLFRRVAIAAVPLSRTRCGNQCMCMLTNLGRNF